MRFAFFTLLCGSFLFTVAAPAADEGAVRPRHPQRQNRGRHGQSLVSSETWRSAATASRPSAACRRRPPARDRRQGSGRRARLHRHALAFRLHAPGRRRRPEQNSPGRHHRSPRRGQFGRAVPRQAAAAHGRRGRQDGSTGRRWAVISTRWNSRRLGQRRLVRRPGQRLAMRHGQIVRAAHGRADATR